MRKTPVQNKEIQSSEYRQIVVATSGFIFYGVIAIVLLALSSSTWVLYSTYETQPEPVIVTEAAQEQFPIGVNPRTKEIVENPIVDTFFEDTIDGGGHLGIRTGFFERMLGELALMNWYQNLASLSTRILVIQAGERKEQVVENFSQILKWDAQEKTEFLTLMQGSDSVLFDGVFFPGTYTVSKEATPLDVATLVRARFESEIRVRYGETIEEVLPLKDALIIASLLEREAYDFTDMRYISGIIWNRLFIDMRLQLDASLQYAKGSRAHEPWWPKVVPDDKYIDSLFNTYKHTGLPPAPIANASLESVLAALNPVETECMYYFHDADSMFHCSKTYEEHVALLKKFYGRGR